MTAPYPPIPLGPPNDTTAVPAATWNGMLAHLRNLFSYVLGGFRTTRPMVVMHQSAAQQFALALHSGQELPQRFDVVDLDTDHMFSGQMIGRLTVRTGGLWQFRARVTTLSPTTNGDGKLWCALAVNGVYVDTSGVIRDMDVNSGTVPVDVQKLPPAIYSGPQGCGTITMRRVRCQPGDLVTVRAWQTNSDNTDVYVGNVVFGECWLDARWITP